MITLIASAIFIAGEFVYHRWKADHDHPPPSNQALQIPLSDEGTAIPLLFGRVRIRRPILAWFRLLQLIDPASARAHMLFILGIPMDDGNGVTRVHNMWRGDVRLDKAYTAYTGNVDANGTWLQTGDGGPEASIVALGTLAYIETLNGKPTQVVAADASTTSDAPTFAGRAMLAAMTAANISSYRGYVSVFLHGFSGWPIARAGEAAYSFEASSYRDGGGYPAVGIYATVGQDCNPMNALYDILKAKLGKLGYPTTLIDLPSFQTAATTLYTEGNGYSRAVEDMQTADQLISEILAQVDGVLYEDASTGKLKVKLVRGDYDPRALFEITKDNCDKLSGLAVGGWTGIVNKVRIVYTDRSLDYRDNSVTAQNSANAVGQDGLVREVVLRMPGVCDRPNALRIAARELAARSRPIIKMRAMCDRSALRLNPGDAVKVTWPAPSMSGLVFRVAAPARGTLEDGKIAIDLISDFFYTYRAEAPRDPGIGALDTGTLTIGLR